MPGELSLRKLRFYTKDEDECILYKVSGKGVKAARPIVYVYEHTGTMEQALEAFMPLGSFVMAATDDSFIAFPMKGIAKVGESAKRLLYRVEAGRVSPLESVCKLCKNRVKRVLSGCDPCEALKMVPQLHPMVAVNLKSELLVVDHHGDKRRKLKQKRTIKVPVDFSDLGS